MVFFVFEGVRVVMEVAERIITQRVLLLVKILSLLHLIFDCPPLLLLREILCLMRFGLLVMVALTSAQCAVIDRRIDQA
jgi:hypothetical protein